VLIEQLGLPVPAYPTLIVAGALAAHGTIPAGPLVLAVLVAALAADDAVVRDPERELVHRRSIRSPPGEGTM